MMRTAPPLTLTREQASRVQGYIQTYRHYAFASLAPSTARNGMLRSVQAIQSKLVEVMDQQTTPVLLVLTTVERTTLQVMTAELLALYGQEPASAERNATLGDLAALKATFARC